MLTPEELKKKVFAKGFRGYNTEEVDSFLATVCKEFEYLYLDNMQLKQTIERVSSKLEYYQKMEITMQSALTVAQETADEVKVNSVKQAELMNQETQAKCQQIIVAAQNEAQRLVSEATEKAAELYSQIKIRTDNLKRATEMECQKMRNDADAYAVELKSVVEKETNALKETTENVCRKHSDDAVAETKKLMETTREEANDLMTEANTNYHKIIADAEDRSRKMIFDAETKVTFAKNEYDNLMRKANLFSKNMMTMLQSQISVMKDFEDEEAKRLAQFEETTGKNTDNKA